MTKSGNDWGTEGMRFASKTIVAFGVVTALASTLFGLWKVGRLFDNFGDGCVEIAVCAGFAFVGVLLSRGSGRLARLFVGHTEHADLDSPPPPSK
jgi:hypothetical protein